MTIAWAGAGLALLLAVVAGLADRRRARRADPDRVGWVDWRALQFVGLAAFLIFASIGFNA